MDVVEYSTCTLNFDLPDATFGAL
eukprot:SAG11_NODE_17341_length_521_cov_1.007109_2_plen_23_part_01